MRYISYCFSTLLLLFILSSCGSESTPVYNLTTTPTPEEAGTVSPSTGEFDEGETVEITATPNEDWLFDGWEGDASGGDNPITVTMNADKDIAATFVLREYPLTIEIEGEGTVSEQIVQEKTTDYEVGTTVELTANPADGWEFSHWEGDLDGNENPHSIEIESEKSVTAVFKIIYFYLNTEIDEGKGTFEVTLISGNESEDRFQKGSKIEIKAIADEGWEFQDWVDFEQYSPSDCENVNRCSENPITIEIIDETFVAARFYQHEYTLGINISGQGKVLLNGEEADQEQEHWFWHGAEVEVEVLPDEGWEFVNWGGDFTSTENPIIVTIKQNTSATAILEDTTIINSSPFAGGDGSELNPFKVSTIQQVQEIRNFTNKHFSQINNIDASETKNWNSGEGFKPIGDGTIPFTGSYNGNEFVISNLYINVFRDAVGLFGVLDGSLLKNIILNKVNMKAGDSDASGLAKYVSNSTIDNCHVSGTIYGSWRTGGLVGQLGRKSVIMNSSTDVSLSGYARVGGLVGINRGEIQNSYSNGSIKARWQTAGGLVGLNYGSISKSFSSANVESSTKNAGGLVGNNSGGNVNYSYSNGDIFGTESVGGLIGVNKSDFDIVEVYSASKVTGTEDTGGLIGVNGSSISSSYWDTESSKSSNAVGRGISDGIIGLTTSEIQGSTAEENMPEFDWEEIWTTTDEYPVLRWQQ